MENSKNATKSLWQLKSLRWSVGIISLVTAILVVIIILHQNLRFDLTYEGWNNLLIIFRIPLGILALIIPAVAVIAYNHRSVQTKELILVQTQQNRFSNYYKYIEEFYKHLDKLKEEYKNFNYENNIHNKLFPKAMDGIYSISKPIATYVRLLSEDILDLLEQYKPIDSDENLKIISNIEESFTKIFSAFGAVISLSGIRIKINSEMYVLSGSTTIEYFNSISYRIGLIKSILRFDRTFQILPILRELSNLKFDEIEALDIKNIQYKNGVDISKIIRGVT